MNAYDTLPGEPYTDEIKEIKEVIETQVAMGSEGRYRETTGGLNYAEVDNEKLGGWVHPFTMGDKVYGDPRPFLNSRGGVRLSTDHAFLTVRMAMEQEWSQSASTFESFITPCAAVFGQWVSGSVLQRYGLTAIDEVTVKVLASTWYIAVILAGIEVQNTEDRLKNDLGNYISVDDLITMSLRSLGSRGVGIPAEFTNELLESNDGIFCKALVTGFPSMQLLTDAITDSISTKLGEFSPLALRRIMAGGSWLGYMADTFSLVAMEYPPMLVSMLYFIEKNPSFRNKTRIGRSSNIVGRKGGVEALAKSVGRILP